MLLFTCVTNFFTSVHLEEFMIEKIFNGEFNIRWDELPITFLRKFVHGQ